jgi:hypothetical protein
MRGCRNPAGGSAQRLKSRASPCCASKSSHPGMCTTPGSTSLRPPRRSTSPIPRVACRCPPDPVSGNRVGTPPSRLVPKRRRWVGFSAIPRKRKPGPGCEVEPRPPWPGEQARLRHQAGTPAQPWHVVPQLVFDRRRSPVLARREADTIRDSVRVLEGSNSARGLSADVALLAALLTGLGHHWPDQYGISRTSCRRGIVRCRRRR